MRKFLLLFLLIWLLISPVLLFNPLPALAANSNPVITEFLQGIPPGYYALMKIEDLQSLMQEDNPVLIDVREPSEYALGHIPSAINIPLRSLTQNLDQIPQDRPVILYCTTGYRTAMGVMALELLGYENVRGFPPSIKGWKAAGQPLEIGL
ncbi:Rhodanese domain protein [Planktothrix serta PCC 8927]|uniref:Rhodanese domain protein n=1 Tax=Planktothrix serta PCC 8927 TaxID=671068 RepID=A0A7Z9BHB1_9CYAN|nr:rhodanese-like domain-containing protein [Planktothrix serta]VXD13682.1 Rhodanese domain protein [Planktothrix serta PCC 8927]